MSAKGTDLPFDLNECTIPTDGSQWPLGMVHTFQHKVMLVQNGDQQPLVPSKAIFNLHWDGQTYRPWE